MLTQIEQAVEKVGPSEKTDELSLLVDDGYPVELGMFQ
jgi:hypothetical protein